MTDAPWDVYHVDGDTREASWRYWTFAALFNAKKLGKFSRGVIWRQGLFQGGLIGGVTARRAWVIDLRRLGCGCGRRLVTDSCVIRESTQTGSPCSRPRVSLSSIYAAPTSAPLSSACLPDSHQESAARRDTGRSRLHAQPPPPARSQLRWLRRSTRQPWQRPSAMPSLLRAHARFGGAFTPAGAAGA